MPGLLQPRPGGCSGLAAEGGALSCLYSFVDNKYIHKGGFGLLIIKFFSFCWGGGTYDVHSILVPQPGIEPVPPAVEVQILNH